MIKFTKVISVSYFGEKTGYVREKKKIISKYHKKYQHFMISTSRQPVLTLLLDLFLKLFHLGFGGWRGFFEIIEENEDYSTKEEVLKR